MKFTYWMLAGAAALMVGITPVIAADTEHEEKTTTDTSKNPFTGTVTEKEHYQRKAKAPSGAKSSKEVTKTRKTKNDGNVEKKVESETVESTD